MKKTAHCNCQLNTPVFGLRTSDFFSLIYNFASLNFCIFELKSYAVTMKKTAYCNCQLNTSVFGLQTSDFFFTFTTLPLRVKKLCCYEVTMLQWKKTAHCNCQLNTPVFGLRTSDFFFSHLQLCISAPLNLCIFELKSYAVMKLRCYNEKNCIL